MAQFMKVQIRIILPGGENLTIPIDNDETFKQFQNRMIQMHDLHLEKECFTFENIEVANDDNLSNFMQTYASSNVIAGFDSTVTYELNLDNTITVLTIKNETDMSSIAHEENTECPSNEFISYKEVDNFEPLINLNNVTESNGDINVMNENIFDNVTYGIISSSAKDNNEDISNVKILESSINEITQNGKNMDCTDSSKSPDDDVIITSDLAMIDSNLEKSTEDQRIYNYMDIESKLREIHETTEELVSDLCRLCAKSVKINEKISMYNENDRLDEKINNCLPINVTLGDELPQQICTDCCTLVKAYSEFIQNVLQADKVLRLKFIGAEKNEQISKKIDFMHSIKFEADDANANNIEFLNMHQEINSAESPPEDAYKCRFCHIPIHDPEMSIQHSIEIHSHKNGLFICVLCELGFTSYQLLKEHVQVKHYTQFENRVENIECSECLTKFATQEELQKHDCAKKSVEQVFLHCETCNQAFPSKVRLNFHRQFHLRNIKSLFCAHCRISFNDENEYFDHVSFLHDPKQMFVCDICEKIFSLQSALNNHKRLHLGERFHKCVVCDKAFLSRQTLQEHEACHMDMKSYQCHLCGKKLKQLSRLRKHLLIHESDPVTSDVQVCLLCKESFESLEKAEEHRNKNHIGKDCIEVIHTDRVFRCEYCEKCYYIPQSLNIHRALHGGHTPFKCQMCEAQFTSYSRCIEHMTTHGVSNDNDEKDEYPVVRHFLCEHCGKSYAQWNHLSLHRRLKHSENTQTYKCPDCYKEFLNTWGLNYHRKTKHQVESTKCPECGKYLANLKSLQIHLITQHSDNKNKDFKCNKCGRVFAYRVTLEAHLKTHLKEFKCTKCPRTFLVASALVHHMKLHRESQNNCLYCGKSFPTKLECDYHESLHRRKRLNCEICDKTFPSRYQLVEHSKIHTNRPYVCETCGLAFKKPLSLKNHMSHHMKAKNSGSFVLMVDMKEEQLENEEKVEPEVAVTEPNILDNTLATQNPLIQLRLDNTPSENYIDIGNGNYLKVQGNTVNIDGKDYILIDQNGKAVDKNQQFQMLVDENYMENQISIDENLENTMMLVEGGNQIILSENQIEPEYIFTADNTIVKPNTAYVIGNQLVLGTDDQVTF